MKANNIVRWTVAAAFVAGSVALAQAQQRKNVILYIGDGFGIAPKTAARMALGQGHPGKRLSSDPNFQLMQLDALKYNGTITTHSLNSWVTDSAPGATCYASGRKIDNEFISFDPQTMEAIPTILEAAKKAGYAVGLVTTTRVTHATPAVFATHIWNRDMEDYIAAQYISSSQAEYEEIFNSSDSTYNPNRDWVLPTPKIGVELDVLLGGGARHFLPRRNNGGASIIVRDRTGAAVLGANGDTMTLGRGRRLDNADLIAIAESRGFQYVNSRDALMNLDLTQFTPGSSRKLLGLFRDTHCDYEQDRQMTYPWQPNLAEMTEIAIEVLKRKSPKGFFLMVEGGRIDHLEHANCGGIGFATVNDSTRTMVVNADRSAFREDQVYNGDTLGVVPGIYGSDYMIKEVLAYDYAVGKGRALLSDHTAQTLLLATSDHECGGFAVVGLHDSANAQKNGTFIRTYAEQPRKPIFTPTPVNVSRGDANIEGWFPNYEMYDFQGYKWPRVSPNGRRIVVAYGSNPVSNGNTATFKKGGAAGTPGNHTPQDILTYADDNMGGAVASKITGNGLMDNTDLEPIMEHFLDVKLISTASDDPPVGAVGRLDPSPNPVRRGESINLSYHVDRAGETTVDVFNSIGQRVRRMISTKLESGEQSLVWDTRDEQGQPVDRDAYVIVVRSNGATVATRKLVVR